MRTDTRTLFQNIGNLETELGYYLFLSEIKASPDELKEYAQQLNEWHKAGKSIYTWLYDIVEQIRTNKQKPEPTPATKEKMHLKAQQRYYKVAHGATFTVEEMIAYKEEKKAQKAKKELLKQQLNLIKQSEKEIIQKFKQNQKEEKQNKYQLVYLDSTKPPQLFKTCVAVASHLDLHTVYIRYCLKNNKVIKCHQCFIKKVSEK